MNSIEQFNQIAVWVFAKLYSEFPNPIILKRDDFQEEVGLESFNLSSFGSTIEFLEREDFLTFSSSVDDGSHFAFVVLTMKGLRILDSVPSSLNENKTLGEQSQSIVKAGFKEAGREVVKTFVSELVKAAVFLP
jgi:hypothetical protein